MRCILHCCVDLCNLEVLESASSLIGTRRCHDTHIGKAISARGVS